MKDSKWFIELMYLETEMRVREYKDTTIELYIKLVEEFLDFADKNVYDLEAKDIESYLEILRR